MIDGQLEFLAQVAGWLANVPFVYINRSHTAHFGKAHRVKRTGDGLLPMETSAAISGINGTEGTSSLVLDKNTILATDNLGDEFAVFVRIDDPFCLNLLLSIRSEVVMDHLISLLKKSNFFHRDGSTGIAFHAASSVALFQVTAEEYFEEVEGYEGVENFKHGNVIW